MSEIDHYEFPYCMHALASAMHRETINPADIEVSLPFDAWWGLWNTLERKFRGMMRFTGHGLPPGQFLYMGFKFVVKEKPVEAPKP